MSKNYKLSRAQVAGLYFDSIVESARARRDIGMLELMLDAMEVCSSTSLVNDSDAFESAVLSFVAAEHPQHLARMQMGVHGLMLGYTGGAL